MHSEIRQFLKVELSVIPNLKIFSDSELDVNSRDEGNLCQIMPATSNFEIDEGEVVVKIDTEYRLNFYTNDQDFEEKLRNIFLKRENYVQNVNNDRFLCKLNSISLSIDDNNSSTSVYNYEMILNFEEYKNLEEDFK